jgi:hypothetical protein
LVSRTAIVSLLLSIGLLSSFTAQAERRFLGSPDGSYKLTLDLMQTDAGAATAARLQRLLIPNRTLWEKSLPAGAGFRLGYVNDSGQVILINDAMRESDVVVVVVNSQSAAAVDYRFSDIRGYLQNSASGGLSLEDWQLVQFQVEQEFGVSVSFEGLGLLVRFDDGGLTPFEIPQLESSDE